MFNIMLFINRRFFYLFPNYFVDKTHFPLNLRVTGRAGVGISIEGFCSLRFPSLLPTLRAPIRMGILIERFPQTMVTACGSGGVGKGTWQCASKAARCWQVVWYIFNAMVRVPTIASTVWGNIFKTHAMKLFQIQ